MVFVDSFATGAEDHFDFAPTGGAEPVDEVTAWTFDAPAGPDSFEFLTSDDDETTARADLVLTGASLDGTLVKPGELVGARWDLANIGAAAAGLSQVGIYLSTDAILSPDDRLLDTLTSPNIGAGETEFGAFDRFRLPDDLSAGQYFVTLAADHRDVVAELDETNNTVSLAIRVVTPQPDLVLQDARISRATLNPGDPLGASWDLANTGTAAAGLSQVGIYLSTDAVLSADDRLLDTTTMRGLGSGEVDFSQFDSFRLPGDLSAGEYFVALVADHRDLVAELDESNNSVFFAITVGNPALRPDLVIQNANISSVDFATGQVLRVSWDVANLGDSGAIGSQVGLYLSTDAEITTADLLVGINDARALAAGALDLGERASFKLPGDLATGTYFVGLIADRTGLVSEADEGNNAAVAFKIEITNPDDAPRADLVVQNAAISGTQFRAGDRVSLEWDVANIGAGVARPSHVGMYLSRDQVIDAGDRLVDNHVNTALASGGVDLDQTDSFRLAKDLEPGTYFVALVADYRARVVEAEEGNNAHTFFEIHVL